MLMPIHPIVGEHIQKNNYKRHYEVRSSNPLNVRLQNVRPKVGALSVLLKRSFATFFRNSVLVDKRKFNSL